MSILRASGLWKLFGSTIALKDINLELDRGLHLLLGPNGSGKTTLLKLWSGLLKPSKGFVKVKELDPWRSRPKLMKFMGVEYEDLALPWWTSGREFLRFIAQRKNCKWSSVVELADQLGVTGYWDRVIRGYSSGMRKKIALLTALICDPEVIILDEPYTLLDRDSIRVLNKILLEKLKTVEAVVIASHVFTGIEEAARSLSILVNGELVYHSTIEKMLEAGREVSYECTTENPLELAGKLYESGIGEIRINGETVVFKAEKPVEWLDRARCKPVVNIRRIYESIVVGDT